MTDANIPGDFERSILLGLSRLPTPAPDREGETLATLSLLAQRKRHRRIAVPATAPNVLATQLHTDPRTIMPDAARRPLLRLATSLGKEGWTFLGQSIFDRLERHRLHPFDLPRLEPLLNSCLGRLGGAERAWLALRRAPQTDTAAAPAELTEADWALLPKPAKVAHATQLRRTQPSIAREWIERHLAAAPADVRAALVGALETELRSDDTPFLEQIAKDDRAASVREAAITLLAATRGSDAYKVKLKEAIAFVELGRTLLGRRTVKLSLTGIAKALEGNVAAGTTGARAVASTEFTHRTFQNLYFSDIAAALDLPPADLAAALPADDGLASPLAVAAIIEGDAKILDKLAIHLARFNLVELITRFSSNFERLPNEARHSLLQTAAQAANVQWRSAFDLHALGRLAGGPVPAALARKLIAASPWTAASYNPAYPIDATALAVLASLMPAACEQEFKNSIADLPAKSSAAALEFVAFTTALQGTAA